jgi:hypothetical protein
LSGPCTATFKIYLRYFCWCHMFLFIYHNIILDSTGLPILHRTHVLLYPLTALLLVYVVTVAIGWNVSETVMDFYKYRVL